MTHVEQSSSRSWSFNPGELIKSTSDVVQAILALAASIGTVAAVYGLNLETSSQVRLALRALIPIGVLLALAIVLGWRAKRFSSIALSTAGFLAALALVVSIAALQSTYEPRNVAALDVPPPPAIDNLAFDSRGGQLAVQAKQSVQVHRIGTQTVLTAPYDGYPADSVVFRNGVLHITSIDADDVRTATVWSWRPGSEPATSKESRLPGGTNTDPARLCTPVKWVSDESATYLAVALKCSATDEEHLDAARGGFVELIELAEPGADPTPAKRLEFSGRYPAECFPSKLAFNNPYGLVVAVVDCPSDRNQRYYVERWDYNGTGFADGPSLILEPGVSLLALQERSDGRVLMVVRKDAQIELRLPQSNAAASTIAAIGFDSINFPNPQLVALSPDGHWGAHWWDSHVALHAIGVWMFDRRVETLDGLWPQLTPGAS